MNTLEQLRGVSRERLWRVRKDMSVAMLLGLGSFAAGLLALQNGLLDHGPAVIRILFMMILLSFLAFFLIAGLGWLSSVMIILSFVKRGFEKINKTKTLSN